MAQQFEKIGLGGGCHWCTEAVFQIIKGVEEVEQGFITSTGENNFPSEAVIVHINPGKISLLDLIEIHLDTHSCTSNHQLRSRYRSAIYTFQDKQEKIAREHLKLIQTNFSEKIVTKVIPFKTFEASPPIYQDYYKQGPEKPFCRTYITPKLKSLSAKYEDRLKTNRF